MNFFSLDIENKIKYLLCNGRIDPFQRRIMEYLERSLFSNGYWTYLMVFLKTILSPLPQLITSYFFQLEFLVDTGSANMAIAGNFCLFCHQVSNGKFCLKTLPFLICLVS